MSKIGEIGSWSKGNYDTKKKSAKYFKHDTDTLIQTNVAMEYPHFQ